MKRIALSLLAFAMGGFAHADSNISAMVIDHIDQLVNPVVRAADDPNACDLDKAKSMCTNSSVTFTFAGCTIHNGDVTLTGSWNESFAGVGAEQCTAPLMTGETMTRTSPGLTATTKSGDSYAFDTMAGTAYDGTAIPDTGVAITQNDGSKSITVNGSHMLNKGADGNVAKEAYALSTAPVVISGSKDDGSFVVQSGAIRVFDQVGKSTSDITVNQVAWSDKTCCHPVSGTIQEVMSGAQTGSRTLTFTATCGSANVVDQDGNASTVTLPACN